MWFAGSDQVSVLVLGVVCEDERPRCSFEMQTHTPQTVGPAAATHSGDVHLLLLLLQSQEGRACAVLCSVFYASACACGVQRRQEQKVQGRPGAQSPGFVCTGKHVGTSGGITGDHPKGLPFL